MLSRLLGLPCLLLPLLLAPPLAALLLLVLLEAAAAWAAAREDLMAAVWAEGRPPVPAIMWPYELWRRGLGPEVAKEEDVDMEPRFWLKDIDSRRVGWELEFGGKCCFFPFGWLG